MIRVLPCEDSDAAAEACRLALDVPVDVARELGHTAVKAGEHGYYLRLDGRRVEWASLVARALAARSSLPPEAALPTTANRRYDETLVQLRNETTLVAAARFAAREVRCLTLNFANGVEPGGGLLRGARAQEETICRSSALYATLVGDPMYAAHRTRPLIDSSDWIILSPSVPVFRTDAGEPLAEPWLADFATCAAPFAPAIGRQRAADLMESRIRRVLRVAHAYEYEALVLGAWGCGAFGNDTRRIASIFRQAITTEFDGCFREIVFAIADRSPNRASLAPFREGFGA